MSMNTILNQKIVRFLTSEPIKFDSDESPFRPSPGKDYLFGIEKTDDPKMVVLLDENPNSTTGIDRSEPVRRDRFDIAGERRVVIQSKYRPGHAAKMSQSCLRWLQAEIESHENMTAEEAGRFTCNLDSAHGSLEQMDDSVFSDIMGISIDDAPGVRQDVEQEIERLSIELGGASLLREIIVWN